MDLKGHSAIVVGGASGLGEATAARLVLAGAKVSIFDLNEERGRKQIAAIGCHFERVDATDPEAVANALDGAEAVNGKARILVNCAGIGPPQKVIDRHGKPQALAEFQRTINVNLFGTFNCLSQFAARLSLEALVGEERGVIINTASVAAFDGQIGQAAYSASKGAIVGMTLPIAREFARFGIRVVTIAPGLFETPALAGLPEAARQSLGQQVPFPNRLGYPDEYAHFALAIIANPMLNGETIRLDGAIRMAPK